MFNFSAFSSNQNSSPVRVQSSKPLQNASPSYVPIPQPNQSTWESSSYLPNPNQEHPIKEEIPYNIRVLLENEQETSSTSSDSEATDTMPDVAARFKKTAVREWDFGQEEMGRRKSEIVMPTNSLLQSAMGNLEQVQVNQRSWAPFLPGRVSVKQSLFGPLNLNEFAQNEKKAYFITIEGFHPLNSRRLFKLERLCHALQSKISQADAKQFLYLGLWNDWHNSQEETDNLFEPWIYAVPYLNFRLVVKIYLSHSFEDPYSFDFLVDVRQFALPTKDKRIQSLEVAYAEQENSSPGVAPNITNNLSIHLQLTNEKLILPQGFRNQESKSDSSADFNVILRQIIIGLPLTRPTNTNNVSPISPLLPQNMHRLHDVYGKRGSAINLGQDHKHHPLLDAPQSPISWSNFSRDDSPHSHKFASPKQPTQADPLMPPGIMKNNSNPSKDPNNYMPGGSLFKFNSNRQQRYSIQPVRREPDEANNTKRMSSDLSYLLQGDKSPLKVLEAYVQVFNKGPRKESNATESTNTTNMSNMSNFSMMGRFQQPITEVDGQSTSTLTASEYEEAVPEVVPADEETIIKSQTDVGEDFRIEDYIGKMVEYAKTYQGSKVLQKYVATAAKDDLDVVIREIGEKIGELMLDPYANYMIQTLVQSGYPRQRLYLLQKIAPSFTSIARDKKGTHSLQAIVAQIDSPDEFALMKTIMSPYVFELSMDPRANYVIQKLINIIPIDSSNFLYQPLFDNFVQVANNSFGLLVLKQMMAKVEQKEALKNKVVELTSINFEKLIQNPYGNYAIQHIVEYYPKESLLIMNKIVTKIIPYSSQKISSNVIEKCLTVCDSQFRKRVVDEILKNGRLGDLMKNKYGNFVTLQLLATSATLDKQRLMQEIFKFANSFNGTKYKTRWLKFIQENPMKINWDNSTSSEQEEGNKSDDSDIFSKERVANGDPELNYKIETDKLEAVKKIWREMTKEEKSDTSPFHYTAKNSTNKKYYNKRDDTYGRGDK
jgi:hypothetical protein